MHKANIIAIHAAYQLVYSERRRRTADGNLSFLMTTIHSLIQTLSPEQQRVLTAIRDTASAAGVSAYLVGGAIRDWLLGVSNISDLDFTIEGDAIAFAEQLVAQHGGQLLAHEKFRTATWHASELLSVDITTARHETYARPAALPDVEPSDIDTDLRRRDFAINAIALRLNDGNMIDPFDGRGDLERKQMRILHPRSFVDDPTRLFRGARYATRLGFAFNAATLDAVQPALRFMKNLSGERVKYDLELIFEETQPELALNWLLQQRVFRAMDIPIIPSDQFPVRFTKMRNALITGEWPLDSLGLTGRELLHSLGWGTLIYNAGMLGITRLAEWLPFTGALRETLFSLGPLGTLSSEYFRPVHKLSEQSALLRDFNGLALLIAYVYSQDALKRHAMLCEWRDWRWVRPTINGDDLKALGVPPGPRYRILLDQLRNAWLDGEVNSQTEEQAFLRDLLKQANSA